MVSSSPEENETIQKKRKALTAEKDKMNSRLEQFDNNIMKEIETDLVIDSYTPEYVVRDMKLLDEVEKIPKLVVVSVNSTTLRSTHG